MSPLVWFVAQVLLVFTAAWAGSRVARGRSYVWKPMAVASAATMLAWPMLRVWPTAGLDLLGAGIVVYLEQTGIVIPAALLFSIAAVHAARSSERRLIKWLIAVCLLFFVKCGLWMVRPEVPALPPMKWWNNEVCLQSTGYTCVAASLVTQLRAFGIDATETEMARLSLTEVNGGTTDTRAVLALQSKLDGRGYDVHYDTMTFEQLLASPKPCVVPIDWGYFASHMVPVMKADPRRVVLGDPLTGTRALSADDFRSIWKKRGIYIQRSNQ